MTPRARLDSGSVTVRSNDPDSPNQTFQIGANGAEVSDRTQDPTESTALPGAPLSAASGCGCKTAGTTPNTTGGWAGIGLLVLGVTVTVAVRRRRNAA